MLSFFNTVINYSYYIFSAFIAIILIREIFKTKDIQESLLYCIILMPFVLRAFHIK